jgi:hypothetical protein
MSFIELRIDVQRVPELVTKLVTFDCFFAFAQRDRGSAILVDSFSRLDFNDVPRVHRIAGFPIAKPSASSSSSCSYR